MAKYKIITDDMRDLPQDMPAEFATYAEARQYLEFIVMDYLITNINIYVDDEINQGFYNIEEIA